MPRSAIQPYYSTASVAVMLDVTRRTVERWLRDGLFGTEYLVIGRGQWRIPSSGLASFLESRKAAGGQRT
jgi:excisionase family DNA binding protein